MITLTLESAKAFLAQKLAPVFTPEIETEVDDNGEMVNWDKYEYEKITVCCGAYEHSDVEGFCGACGEGTGFEWHRVGEAC